MADIPLRNPAGQIEAVDPEAAKGLIYSGYTPVSSEEGDAFLESEAHKADLDSPLSVGKTFVESGLSGLTLGLSDEAESSAAHNEEAHKEREEEHPFVSAMGNLAGGLGLMLLTDGLGGAAAPTKALPVSKGMELAAPELTGLFRKVVERAASEGAGQAPWGAAFGAGHVIHENAIGDPNYSAEALIANPGTIVTDVGGSAAAGVALGGLIGGGTQIAKNAAQDFLTTGFGNKLATKALGADRLQMLNQLVTDSPWEPYVQRLKGGIKGMADDGAKLGIFGKASVQSEEDLGARGTEVRQEADNALKDILKSADERLPAEERTTWSEVSADFRGTLDKEANAKVKEAFAPVEKLYGDKALGLSDLQSIKTDVGSRLEGKTLAQFDEHINSVIESSLKDSLGSESLPIYQRAARAQEVGSFFERAAPRGIPENSGGVLGGVKDFLNDNLGTLAGAGVAALVHPAAAVGILAHHLIGGVGGKILGNLLEGGEPRAAMLGALLKNNEMTQKAVATALKTLLNNPASMIQPASKALSSTERAAQLSDRAQSLRTASNPDVLTNRLNAMTQDWQEHAPKTAMAAQITGARAVTFLNSKLPAPVKPSLQTLMTGKPNWQPSAQQIEKFNRYHDAVTNPQSILKSAAAGKLTKEEVEAVSTVYPHLFHQMQMSGMDALQKTKGVIPTNVKNSFAMLMGAQSTGAARIQAMYASKPGANAIPQPTKASLKLKADSRASLHPNPEE